MELKDFEEVAAKVRSELNPGPKSPDWVAKVFWLGVGLFILGLTWFHWDEIHWFPKEFHWILVTATKIIDWVIIVFGMAISLFLEGIELLTTWKTLLIVILVYIALTLHRIEKKL